MSIVDQYTAAANQAQSATEQFAGIFAESAKAFTEQIDLMSTLPNIETAPVDSYYRLLQQAFDSQRQFTFAWIDGVNSAAGFVREQAGTVKSLLGS